MTADLIVGVIAWAGGLILCAGVIAAILYAGPWWARFWADRSGMWR